MPKPALKQIASLRGCSYEEAIAFCLQVQRLCKGPSPSFKCIAQAVQQLKHQSYTEQDVAQLATELHGSQLRVRVRSEPKPSQSSQLGFGVLHFEQSYQFDHPFLHREWKKPVRVRPKPKPSQPRVPPPKPSQPRISPALKQIADLRGCSVEEARALCVQVQGLCRQAPSFKCIAQAVQQLEHQSYTLQDVAQLATELHPNQPWGRVHVRHIAQPMIGARPKQQPGFTRLKDQVRTELVSPDFQEGAHGLAIHRQDVKRFLLHKWQEITSIERSFGLDQDQVYQVEVAVGLLNRLGVERLRFRQQVFTPPAVGVDFTMQYEVICQCALDATGRLQPHPELDKLFPADYQLLLNLAAVVHYADLVVPRESKRLQPAISVTEISRPQLSPEGTPKEPSQSVRTKRIPRPKPSTTSHHAPHSRVTATKRPSRVDPFRRRLPAGQKPSFAKIIEADQAGISLQGPGYPDVQYTFVRAHIRGGGTAVPRYVYADYQAVKTFEHLLNVLGFP